MLRLFSLLLCLFALPVAAQQRVALVVGNGSYTNAKPLPNATNDARDIAQKLRSQGFQVFEGIDVGRLDTLRLIEKFNRAITPEDTALFYFAGHGLQIGAENWLMPVDAQQGDEVAITNTSIRLRTVLRGMELRAGNRIVILDACRNNPFLVAGASRSADGTATRGLSRIEAGVGSYIAFSTQPGNVALDGRGRNSPFTAALLRHLGSEGEDIHAVMRAVRSDVVNASGGTQVPWENSSLIDPLYLVPTAAETSGRKGVRLPKAQAGLTQPPVTIGQPPAGGGQTPGGIAQPPAGIGQPPAGIGQPPAGIGAAPPSGPMPRQARAGESCNALGGGAQLCASSVLAPQAGNTYGPENLIDNRTDTAWVEGLRGLGEGEYIALELPSPTTFAEMQLINGYAKSTAAHSANARVSVLRLSGSNGNVQDVTLAQHAGWQAHALNGFDGVTWMQLQILRATRGTKWEDTAISELRLTSARSSSNATPPPSGGAANPAPPPAATPQPTHIVSGLDPNGDGFLALRDGAYPGAQRIAKMGEGTPLIYLGRDRSWFQVRTMTGQTGWAHSNWIRPYSGTAARTPTPAGASCDTLWYQRNEIFHRKGYCFSSARGRAAFSNANCIPGLAAGSIQLSAVERAKIAAIRAQESQMGCR